MRRYVSEDGFDSDQCGQKPETACKTMTPVLQQLHTLNSFVNQNLLDQVEDVWRNILDEFQSIFDQAEEEWENVSPPVRTISTPPTSTGTVGHQVCFIK